MKQWLAVWVVAIDTPVKSLQEEWLRLNCRSYRHQRVRQHSRTADIGDGVAENIYSRTAHADRRAGTIQVVQHLRSGLKTKAAAGLALAAGDGRLSSAGQNCRGRVALIETRCFYRVGSNALLLDDSRNQLIANALSMMEMIRRRGEEGQYWLLIKTLNLNLNRGDPLLCSGGHCRNWPWKWKICGLERMNMHDPWGSRRKIMSLAKNP